MTFEEWFGTTKEWIYSDHTLAKAAWEAGQKSVLNCAYEISLAVPKGYSIVSVAKLRQIEDAIAFELGGEPCGLHEAHKLVKAMIQSSKRQANGGSDERLYN